MGLKDVFDSSGESRLPGEGVVDPDSVTELQASDEAEDAPMMVMSQINEA